MVAHDKRLRSTSKKIQESCRILLREAEFKKVYGTMLYWMSPTPISSVVLFGCALLRSAPVDAATIFTILATLWTMSKPIRLLTDAISALKFLELQDSEFADTYVYHNDITMYEKAIKACALDTDIEAFKNRDLTEIGQRGLNMSGGQKQRIQLVRVVYNDADIYLLDDPFSAVDAHTATTLFNMEIRSEKNNNEKGREENKEECKNQDDKLNPKKVYEEIRRLEVSDKEVNLELFNRCLIGEVTSLRYLTKISDLCHEQGLSKVEVKLLGGLEIMLVFDTPETATNTKRVNVN
ncbi:multidrug resistance-associated protein 6 [Tanacetum coccineum]